MRLFPPKWKSKNSEKAVRAVRKLTVQGDIARAAKEAPDFKARELAVHMLTLQDELFSVAMNDANYVLREAAADKLHNRVAAQKVYARIANDDGNGVRVVATHLRVRATGKIDDQALLAEIVKNVKPIDSDVQMAAIKNLTDQDTLSEIAQSGAFWWENRIAAADRLDDKNLIQTVYADVEQSRPASREKWVRDYLAAERRAKEQNYRPCLRCGNKIHYGIGRCPRCGFREADKTTAVTRPCRRCGNYILAGLDMCPHCEVPDIFYKVLLGISGAKLFLGPVLFIGGGFLGYGVYGWTGGNVFAGMAVLGVMWILGYFVMRKCVFDVIVGLRIIRCKTHKKHVFTDSGYCRICGKLNGGA